MDSSFHGLKEMLARVSRIERKLRANGTLKRMMGRMLVEQTKRRIEVEKTAPNGAAWAKWTQSYAATRSSGHSLLIDTRALLTSIKASVTKDGASVHSDAQNKHGDHYSMAVQDKRPYLGLSASNEDELQELISAWALKEL